MTSKPPDLLVSKISETKQDIEKLLCCNQNNVNDSVITVALF